MDAIDALSDAIDTTRDLLTPIELRTWLKFALIVFFVSSLGFGGTSAPAGDFGTFADDPGAQDWDELEAELQEELGEEISIDELIAVALVMGAILVGLWLLYALVAGIMEFVFIESLRTNEVHVRRYFSSNIGNGVRLFLFRLGVIIGVSLLALGPVAVVAWQGSLGDVSGGLIAAYVLFSLALTLLFTIVGRFTSEFVAPIMLLEDRGVLSAWGRFWSTFTGNWTEYVVYLVLVWILYLAISIAAWIVITFGVLALLIPFAILFVVLAAVGGPIGGVLGLVVGLTALLAVLLFVALVWTPVTVYFRYYALLLLGDTNGDLDLIPDQRAAVRAGSGADGTRDDWGDGSAGGDSSEWDNDQDGDGRWDDDWDDSDPWDDSDSDHDDPRESDPWDDSRESERDDSNDPDHDDEDRGW